MAKKPATATLADIVNSPEYKGMNNSVKAQIEAALVESKGKRPLPKTSKTAVSVEEVLDNPAMVKAIKEKIGEDAAEDLLKKVGEKTKIDDTDKPIIVDKQNKVRKVKQKTKKQQELEQQEDTKRSLKDFILSKGSRAFNRMFPLLGALMGGVYRGGNNTNESNIKSSQSNTRSNENSGVTAVLSSIVSSQRTTNNILTEILDNIKGTRNNNPLAPSNNNTNTGGEIWNGLKSLLRLVGIAAGGIGLGIAGAAGISALSDSRSNQQSDSNQNPVSSTTPAASPAPITPIRLISPNVSNINPESSPTRIDPDRANESRVRLAGTTAAQLMGRGEPPAQRITSDTEKAFNSLSPAQRGLISPNINNWNPEPVPMRMGAAGRTFTGEENQLTQQQVSPTIQRIRPIETYIRLLNELDASEEASNNEGIPIPHNNLARRNALENGFMQSLSALNNVPIAERTFGTPEGTFERLRLIRQRQGAPELPPEPGPRGTVFSGEQDNRSPSLVSASTVGTYSPEPVPSETTTSDIHQAQRARIELAGTTAAQLMSRNEPPARRINSDTERAFNSITPARRNPIRNSDPLNWQGGRPMRSWAGEETPMNAEPAQSQNVPPVLRAPPVNTGQTLSDVSTQNAIAERVMPTPPAPPATPVEAPMTPAPRTEGSSSPIDPNNPGPLEPADAGLRYARLFSMVA